MSGSDAYGVPAVDKSGIYPVQYTGGPAAQQPEPGSARSGSGSSSQSSGFQVDSDGVRAQAATLAQCADRAAQVVDRLRASLEAGGMPWGTDDLGKQFGRGYAGPANQGFGSIAGIPQSLIDVANELASQADGYDSREGQIAEAFHRIGQGGTSGDSGAPDRAPAAES